MTVESDIYTALADDATVGGLVSTRIYPVILPQNVDYPAISYQRVGNAPRPTLEDGVGLQNPRFQIDAWAESADGARALATAVIAAMSAATSVDAIFLSDNDIYESDLEIFRVSVDFSVW